jgi:hypothetical protein
MFFLVAFAALAVLPTEWLTGLPSVCVFRNFFGIECLTCGMTRAFSSVLHGKLHAAWNYNHLVVIAFPALAAVALHEVFALYRQINDVPSSGMRDRQ